MAIEELEQVSKVKQELIEMLSWDINEQILKRYKPLYSANTILLAVEVFAKRFREVGEECGTKETIN